ncbi:hypothetical protein Clacol_007299 [Clathrus columnatus]|uniref:Uncharacterized protein n=1 Tax=Clathrus columnatus TaxID=1419009 RepID=A0AAV5AFI8_9AGAM|nr:hypothetical protein Clacol_007299 [Clathrus columnatus]
MATPLNNTDPGNPWEGAPPGSPPKRRFRRVLMEKISEKFEGPWFTTQLVLAGFSPHEAHAHQAFFGWILPTIRTSEYTILQIVGLDAAVNNIGAIEDPDDDSDWFISDPPPTSPPTAPSKDWLDLITEASSYLTVHFIFTYIFTLLALKFIHSNYKRFIRSRQLFSLELVHSIAARTVMVTNLPPHLQNEHSLAVYFENMNLAVESVNVVREPGGLEDLLHKRTEALLKLENAWVDYVGNPSSIESYDPSLNVRADVDGLESQRNRLVIPRRKRPTLRPSWLSLKTVDAIEYIQKQFHDLDEKVRKKRQMKFKATSSAFVTFEKMSSAQIASQVAHASHPSESLTCLAPEPRDIIWANIALSSTALQVREIVVMGLMALLLFSWVFPVTALAGLLSYTEIKKVAPWLGRLIDSSPQIKAIVQNSLPSVALISLMALLPFILEFLTYQQGYRARSWIEFSLLKNTYLELVLELANSPAKVPERLAASLQKGNARHFFLWWVKSLFRLCAPSFDLLFWDYADAIAESRCTHSLNVLSFIYHPNPKRFVKFRSEIVSYDIPCLDFAELNAPPMINYGTVYPQAILIFVVTLLYSIIQPLIVFFGAAYFGIAYVVYKYKLLFGRSPVSLMHYLLDADLTPKYSINRTNHKVKHGR